MHTNPTFTLAENFCFGGQYAWTLVDGELRFDGADSFRHYDAIGNRQSVPDVRRCHRFSDRQVPGRFGFTRCLALAARLFAH